jgi:WD40 repeat protein
VAQASTPARIFVSYARSDAAALAAELRSRLERHGFSLWQDVANMEGGRDWWQQITEAIQQVEFVLLVTTPAALKSAVVRREWRYAREQGRCVIPITGVPSQDLTSQLASSDLAPWMRRTHFVDAAQPEQWTRLVRTLEGPCQAARVPLMASPPPDDFVARPTEFAAIRRQLLDQKGDPVAITAALKGAGGYGKTTLARAICHDDDIQDAFHDGILWVTLGEDAGDLASKVEDLIVAVSGETSKLATLEARRGRLRALLADRQVLIVVDDLWHAADLDPFTVGGERCALLITTRNADTLPPATRDVLVDAMRSDEAVATLRYGLPAGENQPLARLATRLGEWPLLLKLVNGVLRERIGRSRDSLAGAISHVNQVLERRGLTAFDARDPRQRSQAVARTVEVSLDLLSESERARFQELAVFPEDVEVPLPAIERLWKQTEALDELACEELLQRLFNLSLLLSFDLATRTMRLHDVIRAYLRALVGRELAALDAALVDAYRGPNATDWADGPRDGYYFQYLLWHLDGAGRKEQVRNLLLDFRWIETKLLACGVLPLLDDYSRFARDRTVEVVGQGLRLCAHVLARDATQLLPQMLGRIDARAEAEIGGVLKEAAGRRSGCWLRPRTASLTRPGGPLIQTLAVHEDDVRAVAVTPDGRRVVSASSDGVLKTSDLETGRTLATHAFVADGFECAAITPNGDCLAWAAANNAVECWRVDGNVVRTVKARHSGVAALAIANDGSRVVWGGSPLYIWDLGPAEICRVPKEHSGSITALAITPDGKRAVSASLHGELIFWDLDGGKPETTLKQASTVIYVLAITADGRFAVSASPQQGIAIWDLETHQLRTSFPDHGSRVAAFAFTPDGTRAISASLDRTLRMWDLRSGELLATLAGHAEPVNAVAVTPDGRRAVSGSSDRTVKIWDIESRSTATMHAPLAGGVGALLATRDGRRVVVGPGSGGHLQVWDIDTIEMLARMETDFEGFAVLALTPDGKRLVAASYDRKVGVLDLATGRRLASLEGHKRDVRALAITPDGGRLISGGEEPTLRVWDLEAGALLTSLEAGLDGVSALAVTPDGQHIVAAFRTGVVQVWAFTQDEPLNTLELGPGEDVLAITPDATRIVSGSRDGTLTIRHLDGGGIAAMLVGHANQPVAVAFTPDDKRLMSSALDRTVIIWDLQTAQKIAALDADWSLDALVCAGNRSIVAGDSGGSLHFFELMG